MNKPEEFQASCKRLDIFLEREKVQGKQRGWKLVRTYIESVWSRVGQSEGRECRLGISISLYIYIIVLHFVLVLYFFFFFVCVCVVRILREDGA